MKAPTFDEVAEFIRECAQVPIEQPIRNDTQFESELGIAGDDGGVLLQAVQKHLAIELSTEADGYRKVFGLDPYEYLFNPERALTVGDLYDALIKVQRPGNPAQRP
jgi:hypothetical protein